MNKVSAFMELIQIEKTGDIFIIIRGDSGPGWGGTTLLEKGSSLSFEVPPPSPREGSDRKRWH